MKTLLWESGLYFFSSFSLSFKKRSRTLGLFCFSVILGSKAMDGHLLLIIVSFDNKVLGRDLAYPLVEQVQGLRRRSPHSQ